MKNKYDGSLTPAQTDLLLAHIAGPQRVAGPRLFRFIALKRAGLIKFDEHPQDQAVETSTITELGREKTRRILEKQADRLTEEAMA